MSYILEALKKSQAERQLGELPSIHAPQVQLNNAPEVDGARRLPMLLGLGGVCIAAAALWVWQPWHAAAPVSAPAPVPAPVAAVAPPVVAAPAGVPASAPVLVAAPAPLLARPAPVSVPAPAQPAPVIKAAPAPVSVPAATPVEDVAPGLRDLPEPIQRQIPAIVLGGYIYSKDPADRLLLIDKVLRHEGEEVAPGLVLDKLQPKAAIFSFKGYRYRVPY